MAESSIIQGMFGHPGKWKPALWHAIPISSFVLGLFYYWFAVADRHVVFLYNHMGATPFDELTRSRYWMAGLVASGAVMVLYTVMNWMLGRVASGLCRHYCPPTWWRVWLLSVIPLTIGIPVITMTCNQPTLPPLITALCIMVTSIGLALSLAPSSLAAQRPSEIGWLALYGMGFTPSLLLLRAIELPSKGLASTPRAFLLVVGGTLAGVVWLGVMAWLRTARQKSLLTWRELLVAGLCFSYLLMPLLHHLLFVPPNYRYISTSSNFFAFNPGIQLMSLIAATVLAIGTTRLQRYLQDHYLESQLQNTRQYFSLVAGVVALIVPLFAVLPSMSHSTVAVDIGAQWYQLDFYPDHHGIVSKLFFPFVAKPSVPQPPPDLTIDSLETTQSVQDPINRVPLVSGRATVVRAYARTDGFSPVPNIWMSLQGSRGGNPLPGSPLMVGPGTVVPSPSRAAYASSFNISLPTEWTSGSVTLVAMVDASHVISEGNELNNTATLVTSFNPVPPLYVRIVPISYTHQPSGTLFPAVASDFVSEYMMRLYPLSEVNVSFRAPIAFVGDLAQSNEWNRLLNQVTAAKVADGAPAAMVYYGAIPYYDTQGKTIPFAWGGYAWIGWRVSVGLGGYAETAAHEIGHNFGRWHAPCGNPANPDPNYPYPNASIGQYGLDIQYSCVLDPDWVKDLMSYCYPKWLSDYNYKALYQDQILHGLLAADVPGPGILIRGVFDDRGVPSLLPVYMLSDVRVRNENASDYVLELLDARDDVLVSYPVRVDEAQEDGIVFRAVNAVVPQSAVPVFKVRLLHSGVVVAERYLRHPTSYSEATVWLEEQYGSLRLRWAGPEVPALVRFRGQGDDSWTTIALDVLTGELWVDPSILPSESGQFEVVLADCAIPTELTLYRAK